MLPAFANSFPKRKADILRASAQRTASAFLHCAVFPVSKFPLRGKEATDLSFAFLRRTLARPNRAFRRCRRRLSGRLRTRLTGSQRKLSDIPALCFRACSASLCTCRRPRTPSRRTLPLPSNPSTLRRRAGFWRRSALLSRKRIFLAPPVCPRRQALTERKLRNRMSK